MQEDQGGGGPRDAGRHGFCLNGILKCKYSVFVGMRALQRYCVKRRGTGKLGSPEGKVTRTGGEK